VVTPAIQDVERLQGFDPDWTLPAQELTQKRGSRWKLVGNAVTVNVAEWIGRRLRQPGKYDPFADSPLMRSGAWPEAAWNMGEGRFVASVSRWPVAIPSQPIHDFLDYEPAELSARATAGFLSRLRSSSLRYPTWFERVLERQIERVSK
jgi:DNA (cytosine-5)-methyltransferase 1